MKKWKKIFGLMLSLCLFGMTTLSVAATETKEENQGTQKVDYSYRIRIFAGNQGTFAGGASVREIPAIDPNKINVAGESVYKDDMVELVAVEDKNDGRVKLQIIFDYRDKVTLNDNSKYYVRGIRQSGRDNDTVAEQAALITGDRDYVVAYGLRGEMVPYYVRFVDTNGNELAKMQEYEGKVGDKPVVAYLYIDGYQPNAYNLTGTLKPESEGRNEFTFVYTRTSRGGGGGRDEVITTTVDGETTYVDGGTTVGDGGTTFIDDGVTAIGGGGAGGGGGADEAGGEVAIPDEGTPLGEPEQLIDLDEEEVPLAGNSLFEIGGNAVLLGIPVWIIIVAGAAIAVGLRYMFVCRKRKREETES